MLIQALVRGYQTRCRFNEAIQSLVSLQSTIRASTFRRAIHKNAMNKAAVQIQSAGRGFLARKQAHKVRRAAIVIQSCARKQIAKKEYAKLKEEAKSLNKMQEVQYSLENKVIELTQSLGSKLEDNNRLMNEIEQLKNLVEKSQTEHAELKTRSLQMDDEHSTKITEYETSVVELNGEITRVKIDYEKAKDTIEQLTEAQDKIKTELTETLAQLKQAHEELAQSNEEKDTLYGTVEKLKAELQELQDHLSSGKFNNTTLGTIPNGTSSLAFAENKSAGANVEYNDGEGDMLEEINDELLRLLTDSQNLHTEIVEGLFKGLKLPPAVVASQPTEKEVLYPARIIIIILSDMWRLGLTGQSETLFGEVLSVIQSIAASLTEEDAITYGAYWLTNTHELYSFVSYAQSTVSANKEISKVMGEEDYNTFLELIADAKEDFESLSYNIYNIWMKKIMNILEKKAIQAVNLGQSLPGFMAQEQSPLLSKMFVKEPKYKMDDVLTFFNNVYWAMKSYYFEDMVIGTVITDLLKFIDACCFNDLIMRRNFLSWKRGLQLNYNVMRIDEWCKGHGINDVLVHLSHVFQVSKLLQLRKNTPEDIDIIYEICHSLTPVQVQKLFALYHVADYEVPISPAITQGLADKVRQSGHTDFLEPVNKDRPFEDPFRLIELRPFNKIEAYVPARLNLPVVRRIVELSTMNATYQSGNNGEGED